MRVALPRFKCLARCSFYFRESLLHRRTNGFTDNSTDIAFISLAALPVTCSSLAHCSMCLTTPLKLRQGEQKNKNTRRTFTALMYFLLGMKKWFLNLRVKRNALTFSLITGALESDQRLPVICCVSVKAIFLEFWQNTIADLQVSPIEWCEAQK